MGNDFEKQGNLYLYLEVVIFGDFRYVCLRGVGCQYNAGQENQESQCLGFLVGDAENALIERVFCSIPENWNWAKYHLSKSGKPRKR